MAVLMLADLWTVDKRYLNDGDFVRQKAVDVYKETVADQEIFKDKDPSYRVVTLIIHFKRLVYLIITTPSAVTMPLN